MDPIEYRKLRYKLPVDYSSLSYKAKRQVREQYIKEQKGICIFCKCSLDDLPPKHIMNKPIRWKMFPEKFLDRSVHLHHDHFSGLTKGAVHSYCNAVLWQYYGE